MLRSLIFTLLLAFVFFVVDYSLHPAWLHPYWPLLLLFFASLSFLQHRLLSIGNERGADGFVLFYLAFTVLRLVLSLTFLGFFIWQRVPGRGAFVGGFLGLFICYTAFEIYGLTRNLRPNS
jgi:hypothetical protein